MIRKLLVLTLACAGLVLFSAGVASAQYGPTNTITVSPTTVAAGGAMAVSGGCFQPGSAVTITFRSDPVVLGTVNADASGNVSATVTIPSNASAGTHTIELSGTGCDGQVLVQSASVTVSGAGGSGSGALPVTGSSAKGGLVVGSVALIVAGALLVLIANRRKPPIA